jgi:hypothetical protein
MGLRIPVWRHDVGVTGDGPETAAAVGLGIPVHGFGAAQLVEHPPRRAIVGKRVRSTAVRGIAVGIG